MMCRFSPSSEGRVAMECTTHECEWLEWDDSTDTMLACHYNTSK